MISWLEVWDAFERALIVADTPERREAAIKTNEKVIRKILTRQVGADKQQLLDAALNAFNEATVLFSQLSYTEGAFDAAEPFLADVRRNLKLLSSL